MGVGSDHCGTIQWARENQNAASTIDIEKLTMSGLPASQSLSRISPWQIRFLRKRKVVMVGMMNVSKRNRSLMEYDAVKIGPA